MMMKIKNRLNASVLRLYALVMIKAHKIPKKELPSVIEELEGVLDDLKVSDEPR